MTNQINGGLDLIRQLAGFSMSVDMHEENSGLFPEEMIVQGRNLKPVFKQGRHYGIHLVLCQNQVSHHHFFSAIAFGHGEPATKTKRSRQRVSCNLHMQIVPWDVDLEDVRFVVATLAHDLQDFLIVTRSCLRISECRDDGKAKYQANSHHQFCSNSSHNISLKEVTLLCGRLQIVERRDRVRFCPEADLACILERVVCTLDLLIAVVIASDPIAYSLNS